MPYEFKIIGPDHRDYVPARKRLDAMSSAGLKACVDWLNRSSAWLDSQNLNESPSSELLTIGLRQGVLLQAYYVDDEYGPRISFTVPNRNPRFVNPAAFCTMRLLALPGRDCEWWFDRSTEKDYPPDRQRWYLRFSREDGTGIWGLRILANAQPGEVIRQQGTKLTSDHLGHYDIRLSNLLRTSRDAMVASGKRMRETYRGREHAIQIALKNFGSGIAKPQLTRNEYEALLRRSFALLDKLHGNDVLSRL